MRITTSRRRLAAVLVAAAATAAVSLASPAVSYADDTDGTATPSQDQFKALYDVTQKYHPLGVYGNDDYTLTVVALPADTPPADGSEMQSEFPAGMNVLGYISQFTKDEEQQLEEEVMAKGWIADSTVEYHIGVSYNAKDDVVEVATDAPESDTQALADAHPGKIEVQRTRFETQENRFNDGSPYNGGASIVNSSSNATCTAGVPIKHVFTGTRYMTTAAHCGRLGDVYQQKQSNGNAGAFFGRTISELRGLDTAVMNAGGYRGWIWAGGSSTSTTEKWIEGGTSVWRGMKVCVSGQTTFNHCGHPVSNTRFSASPTITGGNGFAYDQGGTRNSNGTWTGRTTDPGDSGAPVYATDSSGSAAFIAGMHSGRFLNSRNCGCWTMFGPRLGPVLESANADLVYASDR
ncbi:hypothetical protein [Streptomyces neyagawaensis]|uniref:hypothetical protein n=1 Tax=Streptomyces neyagawaensis TaxID=42238 RepID=UPI0006E35ED1|nr:hypothetical protein [Streptomyces neyagawaensis]MCL6737988.1 S1 family peptidase [Streptomyces neyagawaensis]MDE1688293.1 hypothetical protein [Streptomyces neyagawaensis]